MVNEVDSIGMEFDERKTMKTEETQVFLSKNSGNFSACVCLILDQKACFNNFTQSYKYFPPKLNKFLKNQGKFPKKTSIFR